MTSVVVRKTDEKLAIDYWRDGYDGAERIHIRRDRRLAR